MITSQTKIDDKVEELLKILQIDVQHITANLSRLDELRKLVVKRDESALENFLRTVQSKTDSYQVNEFKRQCIRKELSGALGLAPEQTTLSRIEKELTGEKKNQITKIKSKLCLLAEKLRKEYMQTSLLLTECSRLNSMLLKNVFEFGDEQTMTYTSSGSAKRQTDTTFVNLKF